MNTHRTLALAATLAATALTLPVASATAATSASAARPAECSSSQLTASFHTTDHATMHTHGTLVLRNVSDEACRTGGYGGLSYVGEGDGTQIGAAADRVSGTKVRTIVVKPGQRVRQAVWMTDHHAYRRHQCRPERVDGFRVYAPNETRSLYVRFPTVGCANSSVHLLSHQAYR